MSLLDNNCRRVLDLGCGTGITLEKVIKQFPEKECLGIEIGNDDIKVCRAYGLPVLQGDVYCLSLKDESADCCLLLDVIEHLKHPEDVLEEINRVLRPRGKLILVFPNDIIFFISRLIFLKFKEAFYDAGHVKQWHPKEMKELLRKKRFRVVRTLNLPFFFWHISLYHLIEAQKEET